MPWTLLDIIEELPKSRGECGCGRYRHPWMFAWYTIQKFIGIAVENPIELLLWCGCSQKACDVVSCAWNRLNIPQSAVLILRLLGNECLRTSTRFNPRQQIIAHSLPPCPGVFPIDRPHYLRRLLRFLASRTGAPVSACYVSASSGNGRR